jgi:hypothetical protein
MQNSDVRIYSTTVLCMNACSSSLRSSWSSAVLVLAYWLARQELSFRGRLAEKKKKKENEKRKQLHAGMQLGVVCKCNTVYTVCFAS